MVRAKFRFDSYRTQLQTVNGQTKELRTLEFYPVYSGSEENKQFFAFTPSGKIELGTVNQDVWSQFELGKEYYVDFTEAISE